MIRKDARLKLSVTDTEYSLYISSLVMEVRLVEVKIFHVPRSFSRYVLSHFTKKEIFIQRKEACPKIEFL